MAKQEAGVTAMADDAHVDKLAPPAADAGQGAALDGFVERESLGERLSRHPVMTMAIAVAVGAIAANVISGLIGGSRLRSVLERDALERLRMAQRLDPYGDPLA